MKKIVYILYTTGIVLTMLLSAACNKEEVSPFDQPFIHIHHNNADRIQVQANRLEEVNYRVFLSSVLQYEPTTVSFEITHGDGLAAGRDFEVMTAGRTLLFAPGIFEMPIRIKWLRNPVDPAKDNSLRIQLTDNDRGFTLGLPGPDKLQSSLTITKY